MKNEEKASFSIIKIICVRIILILISGISVMAVGTNFNDVTIVLQNGYELTAMTSKAKVSDILEENSIVLEENQKTIPELDEEVAEGSVIKIVDKSYNEVQIANVSDNGVETTLDQLLQNYSPITEKIVTEQVSIPFETVTKNTAGSSTNTTNKVLQEGKDGIKEVTYKVKYQNDEEIEKVEISSKIVKEPVDKIIEIRTKQVTTRSSASRTTYNNGTWSYSASELDLLCAITAQECSSSYEGALAVITTACNRTKSSSWKRYGSDPLSQYKAPSQFCYSIDSHWQKRLNGNYPSYVKQAVLDALNGKRNHNYLSFRAAGYHSGEIIGGNVYFNSL